MKSLAFEDNNTEFPDFIESHNFMDRRPRLLGLLGYFKTKFCWFRVSFYSNISSVVFHLNWCFNRGKVCHIVVGYNYLSSINDFISKDEDIFILIDIKIAWIGRGLKLSFYSRQ